MTGPSAFDAGVIDSEDAAAGQIFARRFLPVDRLAAALENSFTLNKLFTEHHSFLIFDFRAAPAPGSTACRLTVVAHS
jgi:hypothetical protein